MAVLQPADYDQMGYSYVSKPAETMPIYLKQAYPYAKVDDVVAVAYYADKDGNLAVTEFKFNGTTYRDYYCCTKYHYFPKGEWRMGRGPCIF